MVSGTLEQSDDGKDSGFLSSARIVTCFAGSRDAGGLLCVMAVSLFCSVDFLGGIPEGDGEFKMATDPIWLRRITNNVWIKSQ